jgi:hypothetical protein
MTLDLYSYGRAHEPSSSSGAHEERPIFTCAGCGCSVVTSEPTLIQSLGWRILAGESAAREQRALCPGCARRSFGSLV